MAEAKQLNDTYNILESRFPGLDILWQTQFDAGSKTHPHEYDPEYADIAYMAEVELRAAHISYRANGPEDSDLGLLTESLGSLMEFIGEPEVRRLEQIAAELLADKAPLEKQLEFQRKKLQKIKPAGS